MGTLTLYEPINLSHPSSAWRLGVPLSARLEVSMYVANFGLIPMMCLAENVVEIVAMMVRDGDHHRIMVMNVDVRGRN